MYQQTKQYLKNSRVKDNISATNDMNTSTNDMTVTTNERSIQNIEHIECVLAYYDEIDSTSDCWR
jgi:hypothetical protein